MKSLLGNDETVGLYLSVRGAGLGTFCSVSCTTSCALLPMTAQSSGHHLDAERERASFSRPFSWTPAPLLNMNFPLLSSLLAPHKRMECFSLLSKDSF